MKMAGFVVKCIFAVPVAVLIVSHVACVKKVKRNLYHLWQEVTTL